LPFPSPRDLPDPGIELVSPALAGIFFTTEPPGKPTFSQIIGKHPVAIQLRFLQSLVEVASEKSSTMIVPIPIDLLAPFLKKTETSET